MALLRKTRKGVVRAEGGFSLFVVILSFLLRWRRNNSDDFDENFDPARLQHHGGGGGTLPQVNLNDDQLLHEEDDGMGGRLAGSTVGGGIVTLFTYTPQQQEMAHAYPAAAPLLGAGYGAFGQQQQYANEDPHALSPTRSAFPPGPSSISENSSYGVSPYAPPIGRGPSPGLSVARTNMSNSSGGVGGSSDAGGGGGAYYHNPRSAKEREAFGIRDGAHVMNPSQDGEYSQQAQGLGQGMMYAAGVGEAAHQASLAGGPSPSNFAFAGGRPGSVVVHRDGGRVEQVEAEIPPTYDSLPAEERM
ncbi:hypothetical protein K443DRAFT_680424 [Laccaria amethystina LaAM-08-1]|uniref:Unplaced genomic scaffold K443scaffold_125, whole genome shotgun sequence n=1 Tax=Laccaria amethystina LaAM-08-1 TaxID=1095629 RepID=A0A0C9WN68_9AGAR|nr:hypothetical protein K443DRAFT_680424 [Laccaria amethystina LaAM-08-1]